MKKEVENMWENEDKKPRSCHSCGDPHNHQHSHSCRCGNHDKCMPLGPFTAVDARCIPRHTRPRMSE